MKLKTVLATTTILAIGATSALANFSTGDQLGTTEEEVRAALEAKGAVIEEIETEDGAIEVEFTLNGVESEIEVDIASGIISEIEADDTEDDDGEDENDD